MGLIMLVGVGGGPCQKDETVSLHGGGDAGLATGCFFYSLVVSTLPLHFPQRGSDRAQPLPNSYLPDLAEALASLLVMQEEET